MFQSTRPVRGATDLLFRVDRLIRVSIHAPRAGRDPLRAPLGIRSCVSIHAPRAGRDVFRVSAALFLKVSIHAPRAGRDSRRRCRDVFGSRFQSTRPVRGATAVLGLDNTLHFVSIHAPRAGRDGKRSYDFPLLPHIYGYYSPQI